MQRAQAIRWGWCKGYVLRANRSRLAVGVGPEKIGTIIAATCAVAAAVGLALVHLPFRATNETSDLDEVISEISKEFPDVAHLDTGTMRSLALGPSGRNIQIVDVRAPEEFAVSHIPGAINVPIDSADSVLLEAIGADRPVIVYCSVGYRSSVVARRLHAAGRTNVRNYVGSIFAWANAGLPLEASRRRVRRVHPYNFRWGRYLKPEYRAF